MYSRYRQRVRTNGRWAAAFFLIVLLFAPIELIYHALPGWAGWALGAPAEVLWIICWIVVWWASNPAQRA